MANRNFRDLVDEARRRGVSKFARPRPMSWVAERCEISLAHVYNLINGTKGSTEWTIELIARGLKFSPEEVEAAIDQSADEAGLYS